MRRRTGFSKTLRSIALVVCIGLLGVSAAYGSPAARPVSRFKSGTEGWLVTGDPTSNIPVFVSAGGNPGGFIETTDSATGGIMYWDAPGKFLGNQGRAYGGSLNFDLRQTSTGRQFDAKDVILKGGGLRLTYDTAENPGAGWTHYTVPLSKRGWMNGSAPATRADMLRLLSSVGSLLIRAEYASHTDVDDLDNVVIKKR